MNELEYIQCNVYIIQGTTFNIVSLSTVCLSMSIVITTCTEKSQKKITAASLQIFFFEYIPPWFDVKASPPEIFLEHLLQAFYVDAPARIRGLAVWCWCLSERNVDSGDKRRLTKSGSAYEAEASSRRGAVQIHRDFFDYCAL